MASHFQKSLAKGLLPYRILETLTEKSIHGYALIVQMRKQYGVYFGPSTMYPTLNKMEKEGLIHSIWGIVNGRMRKTYTLTAAGKVAFEQQRLDVSMVMGGLQCKS